jgi:hypothetical protein
MSKKEKPPIRLSGYIEEKHTISTMCNECPHKCTSIQRKKKSPICHKVYNIKQQQYENRKLRIIKEVFNGEVPTPEILDDIDNYISFCEDGMDKLSPQELNDDYDDFISK